MTNVNEVITQSRTEGKLLFLPDVTLDRDLYVKVKKHLESIGGKWDTGKKAFVFIHDIEPMLQALKTNGNSTNIRKDYQFFPTPPDAVKLMCMVGATQSELFEICQQGHILEPSAGQGAIIQYLNKNYVLGNSIDCYEIQEVNRMALKMITFCNLMPEPDFLTAKPNPKYDLVIANPPFSKNQDLDHIQHMYKFVKPGGKLISFMSKHYILSENKKESLFREWCLNTGAIAVNVPAGTFKSSGTLIETQILVLRK